MTDATASDLALFILRAAIGIVFVAHGWSHIFRGGKIAGTASWFESLHLRPGLVHAWLASLTELGAGILILLGLATPIACAGVVGTMLVAWTTNHAHNGFFIYRPGEGYEYVMTLTLAGFALGGLGAGRWSLDQSLEWFSPPGWNGLLIPAVVGVGGAALLLGICWRPGSATRSHSGS